MTINPARIHPTGALILVHLDPGVQETPSGLIIPPEAQQITQHGLVLAVGPDQHDVKPNDRVVLELHCGIEVAQWQNTPILLVEPDHVLAVVTQ